MGGNTAFRSSFYLRRINQGWIAPIRSFSFDDSLQTVVWPVPAKGITSARSKVRSGSPYSPHGRAIDSYSSAAGDRRLEDPSFFIPAHDLRSWSPNWSNAAYDDRPTNEASGNWPEGICIWASEDTKQNNKRIRNLQFQGGRYLRLAGPDSQREELRFRTEADFNKYLTDPFGEVIRRRAAVSHVLVLLTGKMQASFRNIGSIPRRIIVSEAWYAGLLMSSTKYLRDTAMN